MNFKNFTYLLCMFTVLVAGRAQAQKVEIKTTNYPIPTTGVVVYVAPENGSPYPGSSTNTGTSITSPWTLGKALISAPANSTVVLRGGEYREISQSKITNKITVQPYPGEKAWIKGSIVVSDWQKLDEADVWVKSNWIYEFPKNSVAEDIGTNPLCDNRDMVFIDDVSLTQVATLSEVGPGKFYVDYAGDKLYIGTSPSTGRVESTRFGSPIMRKTPTGGEFRAVNGTVIKGLGFTHYADDGLEIVCAAGLRLEDNTFCWNGNTGASLVAPTAVIKGNVFAYNGKQGLGGQNLKETIVEDNRAYLNNIENYNISYSAAGVKIINSKKMKFRHNVVEDNLCAGLWLDISDIDNEVTYNTIRRNNGFGIFAEISNGILIAGNLLVENKNYGVAIADTDSSEVWNNTIVNGKGFFIKDSPRLSTSVAPTSPYYANSREASWITRANIIKNNIVITASNLWMENTSPANLQVTQSDYNGYYRTVTGTGNVYKWNNINYISLDAFKAAVANYEVNSFAFYKPAGNPFFNDTTYVLKAGSPAIKAGAPLPVKIAALLNLPAGVAVDLGANQTIAPQAPATLTITTVAQTSIDLFWSDNSSNEEGFIIERKSDSDADFIAIDTVTENSTTYTSTSLIAATSYTYRIKAYNSAANSAYTNLATAVTLPNAPIAPGTFTALTASKTQVNLSWADNADNEDGFVIFYKSASDSVYTILDSLAAGSTTFSSTGLMPNTTYSYQIYAYNAGGNSDTLTVSVITLPNIPETPGTFAALANSQSQINLSWADNADNEDGYVLAYKSASDADYTMLDTLTANTTSFASTGLTANTTYSYQIYAYNAGGNSDTLIVSAVTLPNPPLAATLSATVLSQRTINLSWLDNASNEESYKITRSTSGGPFTTIATLSANVVNYQDTGLTAGTAYIYKVIAYNAGGETSSNTVQVNTSAAGTGLQATYYKSKHFNGSSISRTDATINFNWGNGSPDASMSNNTWTTRWQGELETITTSVYNFKTVSDDGIRLWVNGQLLIDDFSESNKGLRTHTASIALQGDTKYAIKVEYFENNGHAQAQLYWSYTGQAEQIIPQSQLYPANGSVQEVPAAVNYGNISQILSVNLYPNPASSKATLSFDAQSGQAVKVAVVNMSGATVISQNSVASQGVNQVSLDVSSLPKGIYVVMLQVGNTKLPKVMVKM